MILTVETRFNIGDPVYFLNVNHEITRGVVTKIDSDTVVYRDSYTGVQKQCVLTKYDVTYSTGCSDGYLEESLYSTPDEILAMFNDQIEQGDFG